MIKTTISRAFERFASFGLNKILATFAAALVVLAAVIIYHVYSEQTWTGSGTVISREKVESNNGRAASAALAGTGSVRATDTTTTAAAENYNITLKDIKGKEHTFRASKMQYDAAQVGDMFIKNG